MESQKQPFDFKETQSLSPEIKLSPEVKLGAAQEVDGIQQSATSNSEISETSRRWLCEVRETDEELEMAKALGTRFVCNNNGIVLLSESEPRTIFWFQINSIFAIGSRLEIQTLQWSVIEGQSTLWIELSDIGTSARWKELIRALDKHPTILHNLDPIFFPPDFAEIVVPFWPYTSDPDSQKQFKKESDRIVLLFFILFVGTCAMFTPMLSGLSHAAGSWYYMIKFLPVVILALYAKTYSATRMVCDPYGFTLDAVVAGNKWRKKLILWKRIKQIYLTPAKPGQRVLDRSICFDVQNSRTYKLKLEKIATSENWDNLMRALDKWSAHPLSLEDHRLFATINVDQKDPSYTKLWLDALTAPIGRERLQPLTANASLQQGKYILDRKLGMGGQGSAYLAHDAAGKQVVLKEYILPVYVDTRVRRRALESFEHEAAMLSKLDNPSVVKFLDVFVEDHRGYLVLEFIDGINLRDYVIKNGPVPESTVRLWAISMARTLEYLHHQSPPVVHRDFTPDNLILLPDGSIKLIDFMVAQQETESATATVVGKHAYLPPEQFRGAAVAASDIYGLGCTLHYLLTGSDPEPLTSSHPILIADSVSGEMDDFVAQCTCQDLSTRYRQAGDLIHELENQQHKQDFEEVEEKGTPEHPAGHFVEPGE